MTTNDWEPMKERPKPGPWPAWSHFTLTGPGGSCNVHWWMCLKTGPSEGLFNLLRCPGWLAWPPRPHNEPSRAPLPGLGPRAPSFIPWLKVTEGILRPTQHCAQNGRGRGSCVTKKLSDTFPFIFFLYTSLFKNIHTPEIANRAFQKEGVVKRKKKDTNFSNFNFSTSKTKQKP